MKRDDFTVEVHSEYDLIPKCMEDGSVGYDVYLPEEEGDLVLPHNSRRVIDTGVVVKPPEWCFELVVPRSSTYDKNVRISNTVGVIDPSYCGQDDTIKVSMERRPEQWKFKEALDLEPYASVDHCLEDHYGISHEREAEYRTEKNGSEVHVFVKQKDDPVVYEAGDRFCQILFLPFSRPDLVEKEIGEFPEDGRDGFGSTGK